jgi:hypothetical protein
MAALTNRILVCAACAKEPQDAGEVARILEPENLRQDASARSFLIFDWLLDARFAHSEDGHWLVWL